VRDQSAALDTYVRLDLLGRTIRFAPMSGWRCSVVQRITHAHGPLHACVLAHAFMHAMREWSAGGRRRPSEIDRGHNIILSSCTCHLGRASASGELVVTMGQQPQKHVYRRCPQGVFVAGSHAGWRARPDQPRAQRPTTLPSSSARRQTSAALDPCVGYRAARFDFPCPLATNRYVRVTSSAEKCAQRLRKSSTILWLCAVSARTPGYCCCTVTGGGWMMGQSGRSGDDIFPGTACVLPASERADSLLSSGLPCLHHQIQKPGY
jgi:hypothetical protein